MTIQPSVDSPCRPADPVFGDPQATPALQLGRPLRLHPRRTRGPGDHGRGADGAQGPQPQPVSVLQHGALDGEGGFHVAC